MPRSPLTEQYERILTIIDEINSWPDDERNFLLDRLDPKEEVKAVKKKSSKKPAGKGGSGKSARASGIATQLNKQLDGRRQEQTEPIIADDSERCQFISPAGGHCGGTRDDNQHHLYTRADYHQFVAPPAAHAATGD